MAACKCLERRSPDSVLIGESECQKRVYLIQKVDAKLESYQSSPS